MKPAGAYVPYHMMKRGLVVAHLNSAWHHQLRHHCRNGREPLTANVVNALHPNISSRKPTSIACSQTAQMFDILSRLAKQTVRAHTVPYARTRSEPGTETRFSQEV